MGIGLKKVNPTSDYSAVLATYYEDGEGRGSIEKSDSLGKVNL